jgi:hypothetical protein
MKFIPSIVAPVFFIIIVGCQKPRSGASGSPSIDDWASYEVAGLRVALPSKPVETSMPLTAELRNQFKLSEIYNCKQNKFQF